MNAVHEKNPSGKCLQCVCRHISTKERWQADGVFRKHELYAQEQNAKHEPERVGGGERPILWPRPFGTSSRPMGWMITGTALIFFLISRPSRGCTAGDRLPHLYKSGVAIYPLFYVATNSCTVTITCRFSCLVSCSAYINKNLLSGTEQKHEGRMIYRTVPRIWPEEEARGFRRALRVACFLFEFECMCMYACAYTSSFFARSWW